MSIIPICKMNSSLPRNIVLQDYVNYVPKLYGNNIKKLL